MKVWCAETECEHNKDNLCKAKEINISAGRVHTIHDGYIHHWECRTFKMSEEAEKLFSMLKRYFDRLDREAEQ